METLNRVLGNRTRVNAAGLKLLSGLSQPETLDLAQTKEVNAKCR